MSCFKTALERLQAGKARLFLLAVGILLLAAVPEKPSPWTREKDKGAGKGKRAVSVAPRSSEGHIPSF